MQAPLPVEDRELYVGVGLNRVFVVEVVEQQALFQVGEELVAQAVIAVLGFGTGVVVELPDDLIFLFLEVPGADGIKEQQQLFLLVRLEAIGQDFEATNFVAGKVLDDEDIETLKKFDAILLGAIGHPEVKPGVLEKGILLKIRFACDQYINLRPVKLYNERYCPLKGKGPDDIDFVVVRENSEGLYKGMGEFRDK
ncbi:MAG: hypothetical protein D6722_27035, partial [Bacteroidetes bacterium]